MTPAVLAKLESVLREDFDTAKSNIMIANPDGGYHLFGLFDVREQDDIVEVFRGRHKVQHFSSMRPALSWCIAEKYQQIQLASDLVRLDRDLLRLQYTGQTLRAVLAKIHDASRRAVTRAKTEDNAWRLNQIQNQLGKCVMRAKYLQIRGFNDEIARTRRAPPNRTSRNDARKPRRSKD